MMTTILDAHALLVYLQREPGFETVKALFVSAVQEDTKLLMTSVNAGEVLYIVLRERGPQKLAEVEGLLETLPIDLVDVGMALSREAALLKATRKMSYADCFAAALAKVREGCVVTGDPEFKSVEKDIAVQWIQPGSTGVC